MKIKLPKNKTLKVIILFLAILIGLYLLPSSPPQNTQEKTNKVSPTSIPTVNTKKQISLADKQTYKVLKVIDGDTIDVSINGKKETLRLIGIDTPESVDPRRPVQCFGIEASNKAKMLLNDKNVILEADPTQGERDRYNRLLRYVFIENGVFYNQYMISEGYAHEYTYQSNPYKYQAEFKQAEKQARENKKGFWADNACSPPTPAGKDQLTPTQTTNATNQNPGHFSCAGKTLCSQMISCQEANYYLNTCGLQKLDVDNDGVPCESLCR